MAWYDVQAICSNPFVDLVAVADVDLNRVGEVKAAFPHVRVYQDWRELLDREHHGLDSVNVSVPDHMHAPIALSAMQLGKHCYCQKPLAHTLHETRVLRDYAAAHPRLVTQMGIQVHSQPPYRKAVELVQAGVIGKVKEVHTWSTKKWGDRGEPPTAAAAVPEGFDWDLWQGVATARPYVGDEYYHPLNWRKRLDFGTGTFGDMGCHIFDPVFSALELGAPLSVRSEGPPPDAWNWPVDALVRYVFPGTHHTAGDTVHITWYDGDRRPPADVLALARSPNRRTAGVDDDDQGSILLGTEGVMYLPHVAMPQLFPADKYAGFKPGPAAGTHHWSDWAEACVGGPARPSAPFGYSGPLTEAVLLGSVAVRFPQTTLRWDSTRLRFENEKEANRFVRRRYRRGWDISGL